MFEEVTFVEFLKEVISTELLYHLVSFKICVSLSASLKLNWPVKVVFVLLLKSFVDIFMLVIVGIFGLMKNVKVCMLEFPFMS